MTKSRKMIHMLSSVITVTMNMQLFAYDPTAQPVNNTGSADLSAEMKTFYDMTLLDEAGPKLVHEQFGQKRPIPKNHGKTIEFRKYAPLAKATQPLVEGVTPDGKKLVVTTVTATVNQYGDFVPLTDMLKLTALDNNVLEATKLLGRQAGLTMDTVVRDAMNTGNNVSYASSWNGTNETVHSNRYSLTSDSKLTVLEVQKVVRRLKRKNAPKFSDGNYVCILHPDAAFDLMRDPEWVAPHNYVDTENQYNGEIGKIAGVRFVESTEAKIFKGENLGPDSRELTINATSASGSNSVQVAATLVPGVLKDRQVIIRSKRYTITSNSGTTITLSPALDSEVPSGTTMYPGEGGADGIAVYSCLFIADGAYGVTDVEGGGLETIIKPPTDPLNQRSTVGWKGIKTAEILIDDYMVRLECGTSNSENADAN
ncbi:N4-gp56 family major capsid protein [Ruminococcus sp.]|uniref:N4-gp56 family major capsid protein n=1 Tax=Ruminococcus sp. TaxID=41978 RepID=UPI00388E392D